MAQQGRVFGQRYRVEQVLGDGGMARVFRAVDERLGRPVAIKVLHSHYNSQPEFVARFEQEAQLAASLSHPNIISVYDIGSEDDGMRYIVMEYVEGENLKSLIRREGPLALAVTTAICRQLCSALDYAHQQGVIHRDIKPENVFLTPTRQVKVGDFGIARALDSTGMTATGTVLGSVSYFAPEQAQGRPATAQSDLYSTGVVLYEMLTGHLPFTADNPLAVAMKHITEAPAPPSSLNARLTPAIDAVVLKAMAKDPGLRYRSGADLVGALAREGSSGPAPAAQVPLAVAAVATMPARVAAPTVMGAAVAPNSRRPIRPMGRTAVQARAGAGAGVLTAPPRQGRRTWVPVVLVVLLLGGLAAGVVMARDALQTAHQGSPPAGFTATATTGALASVPEETATAASSTAVGVGAVGATATAATTAAATARPTGTGTVAATPSPTRGVVVTLHGHFSYTHYIGQDTRWQPRDSVTSFTTNAAAAFAVAYWQPTQTSHLLSLRYSTPTGYKGELVFGRQINCRYADGLCALQLLHLVKGTYHVALYADGSPVVHGQFDVRAASGSPTVAPAQGTATADTGTTQGTGAQAGANTTPPGTTAEQGGGAVPDVQSTATVSSVSAAASLDADVQAAVWRANDAYMRVMNARDTSGLDAAFGPALAADNRAVAAGLRAKNQHYVISLVGNLVFGPVTPLGPDGAEVAVTKTESAALYADSGQLLQPASTYTVHYQDVLQRINGRWVVTAVNK